MLRHINETKQSPSSFFLFLYFIDPRRAALILSHSAQSARHIFRRWVTRRLRHHPCIFFFVKKKFGLLAALLAAAMARAAAAEFTDCNGYVPNLPNEKRTEARVSVPDTSHWIYTLRGCVSTRRMCRTLEGTTFAPHLTFSLARDTSGPLCVGHERFNGEKCVEWGTANTNSSVCC